MKRLLILLSSVALLFSATTVRAQYFDHLSLGVTVGTDGFGLTLAAPIGDQVRLRAGYSMLPPMWKPHKVMEFDLSDGTRQAVDIEAIFKMGGAHLLVDWHPAGKGFFLTAGMIAGSRKIIEARNKEPYLDEEDWGSAGITVGDFIITTDEKGISRANLTYWPVRPYFGLGYGHAVDPLKRVTFKVELGAQYSGSFKVMATGQNLQTGESGTVQVTSTSVDNQDKGIIDILGKFPVIPQLKFGLFVRLF